MPGEFYVENRQVKIDLAKVLSGIAALDAALADPDHGLAALKALSDALDALCHAVKAQTDKLTGMAPAPGSTTADWQAAEADVVSLGATDTSGKLHSLLLSIHELAGTVITVRLYTGVNGAERKVYEQAFNAATDPPGLWIVNGTVGLRDVLRVTLQSNDPADDGKAVDYDYVLEAM